VHKQQPEHAELVMAGCRSNSCGSGEDVTVHGGLPDYAEVGWA